MGGNVNRYDVSTDPARLFSSLAFIQKAAESFSTAPKFNKGGEPAFNAWFNNGGRAIYVKYIRAVAWAAFINGHDTVVRCFWVWSLLQQPSRGCQGVQPGVPSRVQKRVPTYRVLLHEVWYAQRPQGPERVQHPLRPSVHRWVRVGRTDQTTGWTAVRASHQLCALQGQLSGPRTDPEG